MNAPTRPHAVLERWTWILIYGGLLLLVLGIAVGRSDDDLGWTLGVPGALVAVLGFALIVVRSRLKD